MVLTYFCPWALNFHIAIALLHLRVHYSVEIKCYKVQLELSNVDVRQCATSSSTMFNTFTNDLPQEINNLGLGVSVRDGKYLSILLYADDVVLIANSEHDLQRMLETTYNYDRNWGIHFNCDETKVLHDRKRATSATSYTFSLCPNV